MTHQATETTAPNQPETLEITCYDQKTDGDLSAEDSIKIIEIDTECLPLGIRNEYPAKKPKLTICKALFIRKRGIIIGSLTYKEMPDEIHLSILNVAKAYQRQGLGKVLLNELITLAGNKQITLESPPWNQTFYASFGFKVYRSDGIGYWNVKHKDEKNPATAYPVRTLEMRAQMTAQDAAQQFRPHTLKFIRKNHPAPADAASTLEGRACIEATKNLTIYARNNTSAWYNFFTRSREKEYAFESIEEMLNIQLADFDEVYKFTMAEIAATVTIILRNAMIVRGFAFFSDKTHSGNALIKLLSGGTHSPLILRAHIDLINKLLLDYHQLEINKNSYLTVRNTLFANGSFKSTPIISPYLYQAPR